MTVGSEGSASSGLAPVTASALRRPDCSCGMTVWVGANIELDLAAEQVGERLAGALVRDVLQVDVRLRLEELAREVRRGADSGRPEAKLAGFALA